MRGGIETHPPQIGRMVIGFEFRVEISIDISVVGVVGDVIERCSSSGSGFVYTKIGRKWIDNGNIVTEDSVSSDNIGYNVAPLGSTALFRSPLIGKLNIGSA